MERLGEKIDNISMLILSSQENAVSENLYTIDMQGDF